MAGNVLARIMVCADDHLSSKNIGAHRDYPGESLHYFRMKTKLIEELGVTHYIGLGDLTTGRFTTLEYRAAVEEELVKQYQLTGGRRWELKGNHDKATYGMTEYEYYIAKGLIRPADNLSIGNVNISMVDFGKEQVATAGEPGCIIKPSEETIDIVLAHNLIVNDNSQLPNYGTAIDLEKQSHWYGINYLVVGHIHEPNIFEGRIVDSTGTMAHKLLVQYPGCLARPAYRKDLPGVCNIVVITIYDTGEVEYDSKDIELWSEEKSFNIEKMEKEREVESVKRVDVSDIAEALANYKTVSGSPEDIIRGLAGVDEKYKNTALRLLAES